MLKIITIRDIIFLVIGWLLKQIPLPKNIRYKIAKVWNHWKKVFSLYNINITYVFKTQEVEQSFEYLKTLIQILADRDFNYESTSGNFITFTISRGNIKPNIIIKPTEIFSQKSQELIINELEIEINLQNIKYKNFEWDMGDLLRIKDDLQLSLLDIYGEFRAESLTCHLSKMYRFSGILSDFNLSRLSGKIDDCLIDFKPDKVVIYGKIYQPILRLLKKIISFYY